MVFESKEKFFSFLHFFERNTIGIGSSGTCYLNIRERKVYKIFHQFFDELYNGVDLETHVDYQREEILKFSHIKTDGFIFPLDVIVVEGQIIGYITDFIKARPLYKQNPLNINLEELKQAIIGIKKAIKEISEHGILTYDLMYNILYNQLFYIIDQEEYTYSNLPSQEIEMKNNFNFYQELFYFLIEGYFDEFINKIQGLKKMYQEKDVDILIFIELLKEKLSEAMDFEIITLNDASKLLNKRKRKNMIYERDLSNSSIR